MTAPMTRLSWTGWRPRAGSMTDHLWSTRGVSALLQAHQAVRSATVEVGAPGRPRPSASPRLGWPWLCSAREAPKAPSATPALMLPPSLRRPRPHPPLGAPTSRELHSAGRGSSQREVARARAGWRPQRLRPRRTADERAPRGSALVTRDSQPHRGWTTARGTREPVRSYPGRLITPGPLLSNLPVRALRDREMLMTASTRHPTTGSVIPFSGLRANMVP
jgi:hypothetical protein